MKLSVVVPVYNERLYIHEVLRRICNAPLEERDLLEFTLGKADSRGRKVDAMEIVAVDDCSTDGTREFLQELQSSFKERMSRFFRIPCEFTLILQPHNQGKGAAVRVGIQHTQGDIVLIQDADLEYNPKDYSKLLAPILDNEADAVFGSRFLGTRRRVLYFWHAAVNHFLTGVFNILADTILTDMETCYKVMRGDLARSLRLVSSRFGIEPEISARLAKAKVRLYEVGVSYNGRTYVEGKKIGAKDGIAALFHILRFTLLGGSPFKPGLRQTLTVLSEASDRLYNEPLKKTLSELGIHGRNYKVLEIGSGIGSITRDLFAYGTVVASDIDARSVQQLKDRFYFVDEFSCVQWDASLNPADSKTPREISAGQFDLIVAFNVMEHLKNADLALRNWSSLLKPGGVIVVLVPYSQSLYSPIDDAVGHFRRYGRRDVEELFVGAGGLVLKSRFLNPLGILGWFWNGKILRRSNLPRGQIKVYRWLKPVIRPMESCLENYVGLNVLVAGQWKGCSNSGTGMRDAHL